VLQGFIDSVIFIYLSERKINIILLLCPEDKIMSVSKYYLDENLPASNPSVDRRGIEATLF